MNIVVNYYHSFINVLCCIINMAIVNNITSNNIKLSIIVLTSIMVDDNT